MIEETGTIVELKGKHVAVVLCKKSSFCKNCAALDSCQIGDDNQSKLVEAHNLIGAEVGDEVKVATSTRSFLQSSFLLYVVPLIALLVGSLAGFFIGESLEGGPDPNLLSAILGIAFLVGSFLVLKIGTKSLSREKFMPRIVAVLSSDDAFVKDLGAK
jgi:sigma-E factor negative regulatory protein RseC